jgi:acyl-coenzyme A thioesterase PaaI-like protein
MSCWIRNGSWRCRGAPIAELIGFDAVSLADGVARIRLKPGEHHCIVFGTAYGGVVATVLDLVVGRSKRS